MSPGVGPFSPVGSPAYYGHVNPYFNHAPGAPVYYPHPEGTSPGYFDMTAATAGSDAPQGYFPLMPGPTDDTAQNEAEERDKRELAMDEPLAPVGVGLDGFPSLAAPQPKQMESTSIATTTAGNAIRTGEDSSGSTFALPVTPDDDPHTPPSSTSPRNGDSTTSGSGGPIYSSSNKPKLHLGALPRKAFSPPVNGKLPVGQEKANSGGARGSALTSKERVDNIPGTAANPGVVSSSGFRDSLSVDAETGGARRSSWTEAPSRRQSILNGMSK